MLWFPLFVIDEKMSKFSGDEKCSEVVPIKSSTYSRVHSPWYQQYLSATLSYLPSTTSFLLPGTSIDPQNCPFALRTGA